MYPFLGGMMRAGVAVVQPTPTITSFTFGEYSSAVLLSNGGKTATIPSNGSLGAAGSTRANASAASIAATITVNDVGDRVVFGVVPAATGAPPENTFGIAGSYGYGSNGRVYVGGTDLGVVAPTYATGDQVKVATSSTSVFFYKNGTLVYTAKRVSGDTGNLFPAVYLIYASVTIT